MGNIDSLTELANTLDIFFKGLSECNLLSTYSVQLQASAVDYPAQVKFQLLVYQFMKNLQGLLQKIPVTSGHETWKDVDTQTDNFEGYVDVNVSPVQTQNTQIGSLVEACVVDPLTLVENKLINAKKEMSPHEVEPKFTHATDIIVTCDPKSLAAIVGHSFVTSEADIKNQAKEVILEKPIQESNSEGEILEETPCDISELMHVVVSSADSDEASSHSAIFICETCEKTFSSARTLEQHLSLKHRNKGQCDMCSQRFSSVQSLQEHCRTEHGGSGCFTCSVCNRRLMTRLSFRRHMDTHNGKKGAVCDVCGKMFSRADYLQKHYMTHTGTRPHACEHCPRRFVNTSQLRVHERMHSGEKKHVCDVCKRAFSRRDKLKEHMLRHLNIKKYRCSICPKGYAENRDLTKHLKVHNAPVAS